MLPQFTVPLYVVNVIEPPPLSLFGISAISEVGGVHAVLVMLCLFTIVPVTLPNVYVIVTERDECGLVRLIVNAVPIVPDTAEDL